jgi:hypothetical protein
MRAVMSLTVFLWFNAVSVAIGQEAWPRAEPAEAGNPRWSFRSSTR